MLAIFAESGKCVARALSLVKYVFVKRLLVSTLMAGLPMALQDLQGAVMCCSRVIQHLGFI